MPYPSDVTSSDTMTLVRTHAAGDLLMLTALLPALKQQYHRVELVVSEPFMTVLQGHPLLDAQYVVPHGKLGNPWRVHQLHQKVNRVLAENTPKAGRRKVCYLSYPSGLESLGQLQATLLHQPWLPRTIKAWLTPHRHLLEHFAQQVHLTLPLETLAQSMCLPPFEVPAYWQEVPSAEGRASHPSARWELSQVQHAVVIQTRASVRKKEWPLAYWQTWVNHFKAAYPHVAVLRIGSSGYHPPLEGVVDIATPHFHEAFALLSQCKLFIGLDSVFNHAMQALQKPSIMLYGATHPARFGYGSHVNVWHGECLTHHLLHDAATTPWHEASRGFRPPTPERTHLRQAGYHPALLATSPECLMALTHAMM